LYNSIGSALSSNTSLDVNEGKLHFQNWPIYTTNYDLVQEHFWEGIADINDLSEKVQGVEVINTELVFKVTTNVKLVKLHGSLNWYKIDDKTIVKSERERMNIGGKSVKGQAMLYPIRQKDLYLEPWFNLFRGLKKDLFQTPIWIVIGYSFNDPFIKGIFLECLERGRHKMIIVHPCAQNIKEKMFNHDDVKVVPKKFHEDNAKELLVNIIRQTQNE
jgi:hypothetical protein